jgi:hypothetical protein
LVDRIARATLALKQRAEERQWQPDWAAYQQHEQLAAKYLEQGNVQMAFQEYCRAMRPLTEAMLKTRNKDDTNPPIWEKNGE